ANSASALYTTQSTNVTLRLLQRAAEGEAETVAASYSVPADENLGGEVTQYVTQLVGGEFRTEVVVREGAGYATTARAKQEADEREARNRTRLEDFLRNNVSVTPPSQPQ